MARRLAFGIAQAIIITGWYMASFLLIGLVAACSTSMFRFQPRTEHALSQAYYYGIIAAALYFIIASMMVVTTIGAYTGHYRKGFKLTTSQRTLMLQTIMFMVYLLLGALIFSHIENWPFLDAVYWAEFTLLTIGLGGRVCSVDTSWQRSTLSLRDRWHRHDRSRSRLSALFSARKREAEDVGSIAGNETGGCIKITR